MVELRQAATPETSEAQYASRFAGDVTNFSVYLKRLSKSSCVQFFSATGNDALSDQMRTFLSSEDINLELLSRSQDKTVGLYMIHTDDSGERTFTYWRSDSAAKKMFELADKTVLAEATDKADYFYFSGITLAILDQPCRERLFALAEQCRTEGKTIIFDPNYRESLWTSRAQALMQIERAYQLCNILLSSSEDEQLLWGSASTEDAIERLRNYPIDEIILTNGPGEISGYANGRRFQVPPVEAEEVVDTTSAGDAFNAGYIATRHRGLAAEECVLLASGLATVVIGLPGAIIPKSSMGKI